MVDEVIKETNEEKPTSINEVGKYYLHSKTIWVNVIYLISMVIQNKYGFVIDEQLQSELLVGINILLRTVTKEPLIIK